MNHEYQYFSLDQSGGGLILTSLEHELEIELEIDLELDLELASFSTAVCTCNMSV